MPQDAFVVAAQSAIQHPEVVAAMKVLSAHGLGVCLPHMHGEEGEFLPQPDSIVQLEADLSVSFVRKDDPSLANTMPVAWTWDEWQQQTRIIACCQWLPGRVCSSGH